MLKLLYTKKIWIIYFILASCIYAGDQKVDVVLDLTYPGSGQANLGSTHVVDLGFLADGSYAGGGRIEVGIIRVSITQKKTESSERACALDGIDLDSVNLRKLADPLYRPAVSTKKTNYAVADDIDGTRMYTEVIPNSINIVGDVDGTSDIAFFVDPSCSEDYMKGVAIHRLNYEMKLYVEIDRVTKGDVAAIEGKGAVTSIKDIVYEQIRGTLIAGARR